MVSFSALNLMNINIPFGVKQGETIVDKYNNFSEKRDEYVAIILANDRKSDKRANATTIGAFGSLLWTSIKLGAHSSKLAKRIKDPVLNYIINGVDSYINFMTKHNIGRNPLINKALGYGAYIGGAIIFGGALGYLFDLYNTAKNTIINGKISNTKSGVNGSWIQSGLKSLSATRQGKELIKNSIRKNEDKSVTVRFNGINKEYTITKKELKDASRSYVTYKSKDGGTVTGFKKKFSKGDGDVLAFEVAFEKYCKDVNSGNIAPDKNLPATMQTLSDTGDLLFTNGNTNQLYYLLTGKSGEQLNPNNEANDNIDTIYSKCGLARFKESFNSPKNYAVEIKLKHPKDKEKVKLRDKKRVIHIINENNKFTVISMDDKYVTIANSEKTKEQITIPYSVLNKYISEVNYIDLNKNGK